MIWITLHVDKYGNEKLINTQVNAIPQIGSVVEISTETSEHAGVVKQVRHKLVPQATQHIHVYLE